MKKRSLLDLLHNLLCLKKSMIFSGKADYARGLLLFCILQSFFLIADESDAERKMQVANQIFAAGDYPKAYEAYTALLELPMARWQKEIVEYNRGCALLAQKKWKDALSQFQLVNPTKGSSPLLDFSLRTNLAYTRFFQGLNILETKDIQEEDRYWAAIYLFRSAIRSADDAKKAECRLQTIEGAQECVKGQNIKALMREARIKLATTLEGYEQDLLRYASIEQEILLLISGIKTIGQNLSFLQKNKLSEDQRANYLHFFIQQAESWESLWNDVYTDSSQEFKKPLNQAQDEFDEGILQMRKGDLQQSQKHLDQSQEMLSHLLQQIWGNDPLLLILERVRQTYQNISLQDPLPLLGVGSLAEELRQLQDRIPREQSSRFQKAISNLENSLSSIKEGRPILSRLYFEEAGQNIKLILKDSQKKETETPVDILQEGIEKQRFALKLTRLSQELNQTDQKNALPLILPRQSQVAFEAQHFLEAVAQQQQEEFDQGKLIKSHSQQWKEIIALVSDGYRKGLQAEQILREDTNIDQALPLQEQVIEDWFKAMQKLKNLKQSKEEEKMQEKAPAPSEPEKKEASIEQVIKIAQELDKSDRAIRPSLPPISQGEKPW